MPIFMFFDGSKQVTWRLGGLGRQVQTIFDLRCICINGFTFLQGFCLKDGTSSCSVRALHELADRSEINSDFVY